MKRLHFFKKPLSVAIVVGYLSLSNLSHGIDTSTIITSALSPDCLEYRITGICYWLFCTPYGCQVRTSVKISHYVPDAVVTSYLETGKSPWSETADMGAPIANKAQGGGDGATSEPHENNVAKFKNADVIGHPGLFVFNSFATSFGYSCEGAGTPLMPYFLSTLDTIGWRHNIPEVVYPESLVPGMREIGTRTSMDLWGNVYPRGGFTHQADDYKTAAIIAQRAGDIVTRKAQPHVYLPLLAENKEGYWPAGELIESDASTGKWQELTPTLSQSCNIFPDGNTTHAQDKAGAYAWALWRPYSCCERRGQIFLGSIDFL